MFDPPLHVPAEKVRLVLAKPERANEYDQQQHH